MGKLWKKKINLYTQWIHIQNEKYHTKEKYHQIRKIHHLSYLAENIKEIPGPMGIGKTEHSFEVWDLVIVPINTQPGECRRGNYGRSHPAFLISPSSSSPVSHARAPFWEREKKKTYYGWESGLYRGMCTIHVGIELSPPPTYYLTWFFSPWGFTADRSATQETVNDS